jgi:hypothetical protein
MRELIRIRINDTKDKMAFGGGVTTFEAYRELVGEVRGLNDALDLIDEAERLTDERERGR